MAKKKKVQPKSGFHIRPRYIALVFLLTFFVLGGVFLSQQTKLSAIADEKVKLQTDLDALMVEEERLVRMLEYMQTTDYLLQYAREKLGYVFPDDVKFYEASGTATTAPSTTPVPSPTVAPSPSSVPSTTSAPGMEPIVIPGGEPAA